MTQTKTRKWGGSKLSIRADMAQASSPLRYALDADELRHSVFQVANATHDWTRAFKLIRDWLESGNGGAR